MKTGYSFVVSIALIFAGATSSASPSGAAPKPVHKSGASLESGLRSEIKNLEADLNHQWRGYCLNGKVNLIADEDEANLIYLRIAEPDSKTRGVALAHPLNFALADLVTEVLNLNAYAVQKFWNTCLPDFRN